MTDSCYKITTIIMFAVSILLFIVQGVNFMEYYSFDEEECVLKNITYPTSIDDTPNLISCDCGRYCTSDAGTCIRIRGNLADNIGNQPRLFISSTANNEPIKGCTFAENRCPRGEKVENRLQSVENAQKKSEEYLAIMQNKSKITCYKRDNDPHLYLERQDNEIIFYVSVGLLVLSTSCMCGVFCACKRCEDKDRNKSVFI